MNASNAIKRYPHINPAHVERVVKHVTAHWMRKYRQGDPDAVAVFVSSLIRGKKLGLRETFEAYVANEFDLTDWFPIFEDEDKPAWRSDCDEQEEQELADADQQYASWKDSQ